MASGYVMNPPVSGDAKKISYPTKVKKFAEGGPVRQMPPDIKELINENPSIAKNTAYDDLPAGIPTVRGSLPKKARSLWDRIPSVRDSARTGKVFPSSSDIDRAERRENAYETNKRK